MKLTGYEKSRLNDYTVSELRTIARNYYVTFKSPSGETSTNYRRLNKNQLISAILSDRDYKNAKPYNRPTDDDQNRVRRIVGDLIGIETPEVLMSKITEALKNSVTLVPIPEKFYTFRYRAETPNIRYDQHPLIYCENISNSKDGNLYFQGPNYHWPMQRVYRIDRVIGNLYEVDAGEIADLREIPYAKFLNT